jgi:hypothetical protein
MVEARRRPDSWLARAECVVRTNLEYIAEIDVGFPRFGGVQSFSVLRMDGMR